MRDERTRNGVRLFQKANRNEEASLTSKEVSLLKSLQKVIRKLLAVTLV